MNQLKTISFISIIFIIMFLLMPVLSAEETEVNLLSNPGFEEAGMPGWQPEAWQPGSTMTLTSEKVHSGKNAAKIANVPKSNDARLIQVVGVKPSTIYTFTGWIATDGVQTVNTKTDSDIIGANICLMTSWDYAGNIKGTTGWQQVSLTFTTKEFQRDVSLAVRLGMYFGDIKGTAYFDDLKLVEVGPDPNARKVTETKTTTQSNQFDASIIFWVLLIVALSVLIMILIVRSRKKNL